MHKKGLLFLAAVLLLIFCATPAHLWATTQQEDECGITYVLKQRTPQDPLFMDLPPNANHPLEQHHNNYRVYYDLLSWTYIAYLDIREGLVVAENSEANVQRFQKSISKQGQLLAKKLQQASEKQRFAKEWERLWLPIQRGDIGIKQLAETYVGLRFLNLDFEGNEQAARQLPLQIQRLYLGQEVLNVRVMKERNWDLRQEQLQKQDAAVQGIINEIKSWFGPRN